MEHTNYYGDLCTEVYEILHPSAPAEEWEFYRSYAKPGDRILEIKTRYLIQRYAA